MSMLEIESLATEDVSPDDDKGGVSIPELVEECVPDLERDAGIGREKTGSAVTTYLMNGPQYNRAPFHSQDVATPSALKQCSSKLSRESNPRRAVTMRSSPKPLGEFSIRRARRGDSNSPSCDETRLCCFLRAGAVFFPTRKKSGELSTNEPTERRRTRPPPIICVMRLWIKPPPEGRHSRKSWCHPRVWGRKSRRPR